MMQPSPKADMLFLMKKTHRVIMINIPRQSGDLNFLYPVLELLKDGRFQSTKY